PIGCPGAVSFFGAAPPRALVSGPDADAAVPLRSCPFPELHLQLDYPHAQTTLERGRRQSVARLLPGTHGRYCRGTGRPLRNSQGIFRSRGIFSDWRPECQKVVCLRRGGSQCASRIGGPREIAEFAGARKSLTSTE